MYNSARRDVSSTIDRRNLQLVLSLVDLPRIFIHRIFDSSSSKKKNKETRSSRNLQEEPEDWIEFEEDERQDSERESRLSQCRRKTAEKNIESCSSNVRLRSDDYPENFLSIICEKSKHGAVNVVHAQARW